MHALKVMTLCSFFAFGAYTEYNAGVITGQKTTAAYSGVMPSKSSRPDNGFMHRAIELSHGLNKNEVGHPSGSVVVKDGIIVGEGFDKVTMTDDPSAHAESQAIMQALKKQKSAALIGCVVYSSTQPCARCQKQMLKAGISRVYYCIPEKLVHDASAGEKRLQMPVQIQIMSAEAEGLLASYVTQGSNAAR